MALIRVLVAALLAKPFEQVGIEAHGDDGLPGREHDLGVFPEGFVGGADGGVGCDALADRGGVENIGL